MLQNAISYSATYDSSNINFLCRHAQQNNASSNAGTSTRHHRPLSGNQPLLLIQSDFWNVFLHATQQWYRHVESATLSGWNK